MNTKNEDDDDDDENFPQKIGVYRFFADVFAEESGPKLKTRTEKFSVRFLHIVNVPWHFALACSARQNLLHG
jgi:hypothetical protein